MAQCVDQVVKVALVKELDPARSKLAPVYNLAFESAAKSHTLANTHLAPRLDQYFPDVIAERL